jgi:hypothetical protein
MGCTSHAKSEPLQVPAMERQTEPRSGLTTSSDPAALEAHIQCRLGGHIRDFRLVVMEKGLILRGHAHTFYAKQLAQHAVMETTDLPILANEIDVT